MTSKMSLMASMCFMGNAATGRVTRKGKVLLKFTSGKSLCLNNVLFVHFLRRNLVSNSLLDIAGFEVNQKAGKIIILRDGVFVGKGYRSGGLFVLNVASDAVNGNASSFAYIVESVDYASTNKLKNMRLISNINTENYSNCDVCVEAKFA